MVWFVWCCVVLLGLFRRLLLCASLVGVILKLLVCVCALVSECFVLYEYYVWRCVAVLCYCFCFVWVSL